MVQPVGTSEWHVCCTGLHYAVSPEKVTRNTRATIEFCDSTLATDKARSLHNMMTISFLLSPFALFLQTSSFNSDHISPFFFLFLKNLSCQNVEIIQISCQSDQVGQN